MMKVMDQLSEKVQRNLARNGMRAGAVVLRTILREKLPERSGDLKRSARVGTRVKNGVVSASVKLGGEKAWYAGIVEFGAKPHAVVAEGKALVVEDGVLRKSASIGGFAGKGYFRAAADEAAAPAADAAVERMRTLLREKHGLDVPAPPDDPDEG